MPWQPLPRIAFAVCTYPFQPFSPADLPLEIGDELYIIEQGGVDGSWYRGYLVAPPSLLAGLSNVKGQTLEARVFSGIFPRVCVEIREVFGEEKLHGKGLSFSENSQVGSVRSGTVDDGTVDSFGGAATLGEAQENGVPVPAPENNSNLLQHENADVREGIGGQPQKDGVGESEPLQSPEPNFQSSEKAELTKALHPNAPKPAAPVPMLKIGDESPTSASEPLVDEIASCLREWHSTNLHELLLARRYGTVDELSLLIQRLDTSRKQLLYRVLTLRELACLRESTVWDLVNGNKLLNGDIIVRSPTERGRILTAEDSAIEITKLQIMMSVLDEKPVAQIDINTRHHLSMELRGGILSQGHQVSVAAYLCTKVHGEPPRPVSEIHAAELQISDPGGSVKANMKTLFIDLSSADIGEGSSNPAPIYLILRLTGYEVVKQSLDPVEGKSIQRSNSSSQSTGLSTLANIPSVVKGSRRSILWGQKGRNNSVSSRSNEHRPSIPGNGSQVPVEARPETGYQASAATKDQKLVKRVVGMGVLRVDHRLRDLQEFEADVSIWQPLAVSDSMRETKMEYEDLLTELLPSSSGMYCILGYKSQLQVAVKPFASPDADTLIRQMPTLLHKISKTRKIGFSGAPTKPRNDIYFTLLEPVVPDDAPLAHPKLGTVSMGGHSGLRNLQLTLEIRNAKGQRMENCIFPSDNSAGHTAWRSPAVNGGDRWNITIRLAISPEDVPGSHIVMSLADAPGFPFALCWMPLWVQGAFVRDGEHPLIMYKYDEYTSSVVSGRGAYLDLPWRVRSRNDAGNALVAFVRIRSYLCSTKHSQDPNLLGLLDWRNQNSAELLGLLRRFSFVPEIEIVKLLPETFDAIFKIMVSYAYNEEYEDLLFSSLVTVLGIVHDRRFNLGPLVDRYAEDKFSYPSAASCLTRSFNRLLAKPTDPETSKKLRATFKVGKHIFNFITSGEDNQIKCDALSKFNVTNISITDEVLNLFTSFEWLMKNPNPVLIGTRTLLVQNFHTWLPNLQRMMPAEQILHIACRFVDSCSAVQGNLILFKIILILHLSRSGALSELTIRRMILTKTSNWLEPYWGKTDEVNNQWRSQVRLCCSVVAAQLPDLKDDASIYLPTLVDTFKALQNSPQERKTAVSLPFPTTFPFPIQPISNDANFDEALTEISAVLAAVSDLPASLSITTKEFTLSEFLLNTLEVYRSILNCKAFPSSWLSLHMYYHKAAMRILSKMSNVLIDCFVPTPDESDEFNTDLWRAFFDTLLMIAASDALALETFPEQRRRAVWKIAGDVREQGAELLKHSWQAIGWDTGLEDRKIYGLERMGGFQVQYVPDLVGPITELCLSVHEGLRNVAIGILQTMIVGEWSLSQDISIFQAEMIDCLDRLFTLKHPKTETILQKLFISELLSLFGPISRHGDASLCEAVKELMGTINTLLDLLVAVHCNEGGGQALQISETLQLMVFLRGVQKEDIYIRYVHQLARMQISAQNATEAGLALRLHADLYDWDSMTMLDSLKEPKMPSASAFERKEQLYFEMISYFEEDFSWRNALEAYSELATQYEHAVFDFAKLARCQRAMAKIYESIGKGIMRHARYFKVVYTGFGFPVGLRDKQFIFEGSPTDRLASFIDKLQRQHPAARLQKSGTESDLEGQFLQVQPVNVQKDILHRTFQRPKISQNIRDYHLSSRPRQFAVSHRRHPNEASRTNVPVEKTVYTTAHSFPTILKRCEIIRAEVVTLTSLEMAIERTLRKTAELASLENRATSGEDTATTSLIAAVMVSVDFNSEASVSRYRTLLPETGKDESDSEEVETVAQPSIDPLANALKVALIDHALAIKHCLSILSRPAYHATKLDLSQRKTY